MAHPVLLRILSQWSLRRIVLVALALRLVWVLLCPNEPVSDQVLYHLSAESMAQGHGYVDQDGRPAGYWPVGYIALLAPFYAIFGAHYIVGYLLSTALLLVGVVGVHELGRELYGLLGGRLAALVFALHPTFVLHATILASEVPFCAGLPWLVLCFVRLARAPTSLRFAVGGGVLLALLAYVRPPALLLLACPLCFFWLERTPLRRAVEATALLAGATFAVLAPWGFRNQHEFGVFSVTSFNAGPNFWMGNHEGSDGVYSALPPETTPMSLPERDRYLKSEALTFIRESPGTYLALCARRLVVSLGTDTIGAVWNEVGILRRFGKGGLLAAKLVCSLAHWALLAALAVSLFRRRRGGLGRIDAELAVVVALLSVPFVLLVGGNRYMLPIVPLLAVWLGKGLAGEREPATA